MTTVSRGIRGQLPWQHRAADGDDPRERPAPRQAAPYVCDRRGCQFTVPFLAGIAPPARWTCRCGGSAAYVGDAVSAAPPAPSSRVRLDEVAGHEYLLLHKRRGRADLETLLAQRITEISGRQSAPPPEG